MDVTCERCGTEYEFDETLLSGRGTSVKCTNCGHVFKVYPKAAEAADRTTSSWRLRLSDGSSDAIDSLRELQRRISSGELTPEDQIARGDDGWKSLGSIPELETFFQAAGVQVPSHRIPSPLPPVPTPASSESSIPPGKRPRQPTLLGVTPVQRVGASVHEPLSEPAPPTTGSEQAALMFEGEPSAQPPLASPSDSSSAPIESAPSSYQSPYTRDSAVGTAPTAVEDAEFEESSTASTSIRQGATTPGYFDDDDDIPDLPARGLSPLKWLLLIVLIGGGALVSTQWERVALLIGFGADPVQIAAAVEEGDAAVAEGYAVSYASAIDAYGRAVEAGASRDAEVLAKLSNAYALMAQARIDEGPDSDPEPLRESALSTARAAFAADPRSVDARLALVDALRLRGANTEARQELEEVRAMSFSRTAEFFRVDARLSSAEADGRLENGLRSAREASDLDPNGVRYSLLAARAERAAGNPEQAETFLRRVLEDRPEHPVAAPMLAEIIAVRAEPAEETPPEVDEVAEVDADAGVQSEGDIAAEPAEEPDEAAEPSTEPEPVPEPRAAAAAEAAPTPTEPESAAPAEPPKEPAAEEAPSEPVRKAASTRAPKRERTQPALDEYDRLARAADANGFVDGRPPVLDYESNMAKGREELAAGNYARARAYFDSALEVHPGSADAMDALGDVATAVSDYASALRYYRVAAQRGQPDGYYKLGQTYERLGKSEEAVSAYYTYVKRRPQGRHAAEAKDAIRTLEPRAKLPPDPEPDAKTDPAEAPEPSTP